MQRLAWAALDPAVHSLLLLRINLLKQIVHHFRQYGDTARDEQLTKYHTQNLGQHGVKFHLSEQNILIYHPDIKFNVIFKIELERLTSYFAKP